LKLFDLLKLTLRVRRKAGRRFPALAEASIPDQFLKGWRTKPSVLVLPPM